MKQKCDNVATHNFRRWFETVDGWAGQHGSILGSQRRSATSTARLLLPNIFLGLLSNWGVARRWDGEFERRSAPLHQARQIPTPPARLVRAFTQICCERQVVCEHWKRQPAKCVASVSSKINALLTFVILVIIITINYVSGRMVRAYFKAKSRRLC